MTVTFSMALSSYYFTWYLNPGCLAKRCTLWSTFVSKADSPTLSAIHEGSIPLFLCLEAPGSGEAGLLSPRDCVAVPPKYKDIGTQTSQVCSSFASHVINHVVKKLDFLNGYTLHEFHYPLPEVFLAQQVMNSSNKAILPWILVKPVETLDTIDNQKQLRMCKLSFHLKPV